MNAATREAGFGPEVKRRIMLGTYALSAGYYDAYYGQAQKVRTLILRDFERVYEQFDVLISATSPTVAFELGAKTADPLAMYLCDVCTVPSNLSGHPAMSVPFGTGRGWAPDRRAGARARARRTDDVPGRARYRAGGRQNAAVILLNVSADSHWRKWPAFGTNNGPVASMHAAAAFHGNDGITTWSSGP